MHVVFWFAAEYLICWFGCCHNYNCLQRRETVLRLLLSKLERMRRYTNIQFKKLNSLHASPEEEFHTIRFYERKGQQLIIKFLHNVFLVSISQLVSNSCQRSVTCTFFTTLACKGAWVSLTTMLKLSYIWPPKAKPSQRILILHENLTL